MPQRHPTWHRLAEPLVNTPNRTHTTEHTRFRRSMVGVRRVGGWCFGEASTHLHQESSHGTQRQQLVVRGTDIVHSHCTPRRWEILQHPHMYMHRDHTAHGTMLVGHNTWTYIGEVAHGTVHGVTTANAAQRSNEVASSLQRHHLGCHTRLRRRPHIITRSHARSCRLPRYTAPQSRSRWTTSRSTCCSHDHRRHGGRLQSPPAYT